MEQISPSGGATTIIHFTYQVGELTGDWRIACLPNMTELHATAHHSHYQRSNDTRACTCPACKRTDIFMRTHMSLMQTLSRKVIYR